MSVGGGFSGDKIFTGVVRSGTTFSSAFTFTAGLTPDRLFLPAGVRDLAWNTACSCFRYIGSATYPM
ncbi:MAG: hypothetical protein M3N21_08555 [Actinomycetota bacterium]|nr:hypothetical protein [Actinomycetota bacterium]